jgi:hypothetical protein
MKPRRYEATSMRQQSLPSFTVSGGPFAAAQRMGWHIVDAQTGHTAGVACDAGMCSRLNTLEIIAGVFESHGLYDLISNKLHDAGYLDISDDEWEAFRDAVKTIEGAKQ